MVYRNGYFFVIPPLTLFLFLGSCRKQEEHKGDAEARELFKQSAEFIVDITNQMKETKDSVSIDSLSAVFEKKITEINFAFPPQTDFKLTQQENDSIYKLQENLRRIKEEKLKEFSQIPLDTLPVSEQDLL